jgi:mono/diheme cytochrome c family protein
MPLAPRRRPPVIPSRVDYARTTGTCYVADVYRGSGMEQVSRGTIRWLRVVEAPPKRNWTPRMWDRDTNQAPGMNFNCTSNKRVLGDAPVDADGSAYFEVPVDRFVFFQLLDADKKMVQSMRTGTTLMPGEHVGCVGCHEGRLEGAQTLSAVRPAALRRRPSRLEPWLGEPREFNYLTEIQPIFDRHCVGCHDYGKEAGRALNLAGDLGLVFNTSYLDLHIKSAMRWAPDAPGAAKQVIKVIHDGPPEVLPPYAWGSHRSRLVDLLRADHYGVRVSADDLARLITWIDLNAPYYGSYHSVYGENLYGRAPLGFEQLADLSDLTGLPYSAYRDPRNRGRLDGRINHGPIEGTELAGSQVNFTRPELSPCLAKLDRRQPRYGQALAIIRQGRENLRRQPREDMLGPAARPVLTAEVLRAERCREQSEAESSARKAFLSGK